MQNGNIGWIFKKKKQEKKELLCLLYLEVSYSFGNRNVKPDLVLLM